MPAKINTAAPSIRLRAKVSAFTSEKRRTSKSIVATAQMAMTAAMASITEKACARNLAEADSL